MVQVEHLRQSMFIWVFRENPGPKAFQEMLIRFMDWWQEMVLDISFVEKEMNWEKKVVAHQSMDLFLESTNVMHSLIMDSITSEFDFKTKETTAEETTSG